MSIKEFIKLTKEQGYITYLEFIKFMPPDICDKEQIEDITSMLEDMGIEVRMEKAEVIGLYSNDN